MPDREESVTASPSNQPGGGAMFDCAQAVAELISNMDRIALLKVIGYLLPKHWGYTIDLSFFAYSRGPSGAGVTVHLAFGYRFLGIT